MSELKRSIFEDFNEWNEIALTDNLMIDEIKPTSSSAKNKYPVGSTDRQHEIEKNWM